MSHCWTFSNIWLTMALIMAMIEYSEIKERKIIIWDGEPYEVLTAHVFRKQQRKPVNATKLKSLLNGRVLEISFAVSDKVAEADISKKEIKYLYNNRGEYWFCDPLKPSDRYKLDEVLVGEAIKYIKPNSIIEVMVWDEKIIRLLPPIKAELKVTESAPAVRGNTSGNATKLVTLETGATANVPMFINEGDIVCINTDSGEYVERVTKA